MHPIALALVLALTHGNIPSIGSTNHQHVVTRRHHRRIFFYSPVKGSHESLLRQNLRVSEDDLERIQDDTQLEELTRNGELVGLPQNQFMGVDPKLPEERRFCRPWTKNFLDDLGQKYFSQFRQPLQVNSAVRTVEVQEKLRRHNHNAAAEDGEVASPHLTGASVDIGKHWMSRKQLKWTRDYLLGLQNRGLLDVEEEFRQRVFHVTVYRDYETEMQQSASASSAARSE